MNPVNIDNIKSDSTDLNRDLRAENQLKSTKRFDISIIGKIDLIEAEKIASEEVIFLTESDLIEGLEDFELVPIKNFREEIKTREEVEPVFDQEIQEEELVLEKDDIPISEITAHDSNNIGNTADYVHGNSLNITKISETIEYEKPETSELNNQEIAPELEDLDIELLDSDLIIQKDLEIAVEPLFDEKVVRNELLITEIPDEKSDELLSQRKQFSVKINEETLDAQLSAILGGENVYKKDEKNLEKYGEAESDLKCRFVDDQFLNKTVSDDAISYSEDPLTERLVKMIEVADGKLELLEKTATEEEHLAYILEDYTLYNSEKFDNVFKEEVFYTDSDFEFIDNAIIRDDFTKYIHEIDDYFESEESLIQSEISEILGLIPDENEYIEDKLFGDYYKKYDLDNEIDFIKPEIDFFRSNYSGKKNLNYFGEDEISLQDSERISIEEDISSPNAIVFEENVAEIEAILKRDYNFDLNKTVEIKPVEEIKSMEKETFSMEIIPDLSDEIVLVDEVTDITDKIIILEDKEKLMELVAEFPEKHENLIRLLSYLDGLFEKLPEEVIRKFAESEYFELYSKVLKEMGV